MAQKRILVSQPKPESEKSPYFELARKYNVELVFHPFIRLDPIYAREFRKQKIELSSFKAFNIAKPAAIAKGFPESVPA